LVWKLVCSLKIRIFLWLSLANKTLTWDNGKKESGSDPVGVSRVKMIVNIWTIRSFTSSTPKLVWMEISNSFKIQIHWDKLNMLESMEF
jgi:hypothetical protein